MSVSTRYRNDWGEMVPDPEGQWQHVKDAGIEGWKLDIPLPAARAAAPPVEQEAAAHRPPGGHDTIPPSPDPVAGLREALDAWERNGAPNRRSLAAFGIRPTLASDKPGLDAAWAEAEAAADKFREGSTRWTVRPASPIELRRYDADHYGAKGEGKHAMGDTPEAALRALAALHSKDGAS